MKRLSEREGQIIQMMKEGLKNREIALELGIDQKTVSTYVNRIKTKLNVSRDTNTYKTVVAWLKAKHENSFKPGLTIYGHDS